MIKKHQQYSFAKGWAQIPNGSAKEARQKLMAVLHITAMHSWYRRLHGGTIPRLNEKEAIEKVFSDYGVTNIWGNKE